MKHEQTKNFMTTNIVGNQLETQNSKLKTIN